MNGRLKDALNSTVLKWLAGGSGAVLAFYLLKILEEHGPLIIQALGGGWLTATILGAVLIFRFDRRAGEFLAEQHEMAAAQKGLTESVAKLVQKDDARAQATDAAIGFVAQQNEGIQVQLKEMRSTLAEIKARLPIP